MSKTNSAPKETAPDETASEEAASAEAAPEEAAPAEAAPTKAAPEGRAGDEEQLNRAIEELRGVLHEDSGSAASRNSGAGQASNAGIVMNIPVEVQIVLGSAEMPVSELMALQKGSTVSLNRRTGEAVDVVVNGRRIARGEIIVLEHDTSRFGIRLTEIAGTTSSR